MGAEGERRTRQEKLEELTLWFCLQVVMMTVLGRRVMDATLYRCESCGFASLRFEEERA